MVMSAALGIGLTFASLDLRYRDVRYVLPFISQIWMFATPVVYPSSLVPEKWRALYALNPMVGFIETFRAAILGSHPVPWAMLATSCGAALVMLIIGLSMFGATERQLTDIV
jgi:lipopolysaccharide transport system permease protein